VHQRLNLCVAQLEEVGEDLRRSIAVTFARVPEAVQQDRQERMRVRRYDRCLLLQLQPLEEMTEGGEARSDEGGRRGGGDGDSEAFEYGSLTALGNAVVLDAGLEVVEQLQPGVDIGGRLLERCEERVDLLLHGGRVLLRGCGERRAHEGRGRVYAGVLVVV